MSDFQWSDDKVLEILKKLGRNFMSYEEYPKLIQEFKEQEQYCLNLIINGEKVKVNTIVWICNEYDSRRYLLYGFKKEWWYIQKSDTYVEDRKYYLTEKEVDDYIVLYEKKYSKQDFLDLLDVYMIDYQFKNYQFVHHLIKQHLNGN